MNEFMTCDMCGTSLNEEITTGKLVFNCNKCGSRYDAQDDDTMLYSASIGSDHVMNNILAQMGKDPVNPKTDKFDCKCGSKIHTFRTIGENMKTYYVCDGCGNFIK